MVRSKDLRSIRSKAANPMKVKAKKVAVKAKGTANYKASAWKTVKVKVMVK